MTAHLQFGLPLLIAVGAVAVGLFKFLGARPTPPGRPLWFFGIAAVSLFYLSVSYMSFDTVERVEFIYDQEPQYMGYDCEPANFHAYWLSLTRPALYEGMSYGFFVTVKDSVSRFADQDCRVMAGLQADATPGDADSRYAACRARLADRVDRADACLSRIGFALR